MPQCLHNGSMAKEALKNVTVRLPPTLIRALKVRAAETDRRFQAVVTEALELYVKKAGKEAK